MDAGEKPAFADGQDGRATCSASSWPGMLALGPEIAFLLAPTVNSYKRFQAGSFAPTNMVWSRDNRTAGFRVLGHGPGTRIECRVPGADVNPYLAYAGLLAAGLHGVEQGLEPRPPSRATPTAPPSSPRCPRPCARRWTARPLGALREALGDEVVDHYVHAGRWEQAQLRQGGHGLGAGPVLRAGVSNGSGTPLAEEGAQQIARAALADAAIHLGPVVAGGAREQARAVVDRPGLGVGGAVVETAQAGEADGVGAHRAGLEGDVEVAGREVAAAEAGGGLTDDQDLGMGSGIVALDDAVAVAGQDLSVGGDDHGTDRNLAAGGGGFGLGKREFHGRGPKLGMGR